jgi:hypothetical protein
MKTSILFVLGFLFQAHLAHASPEIVSVSLLPDVITDGGTVELKVTVNSEVAHSEIEPLQYEFSGPSAYIPIRGGFGWKNMGNHVVVYSQTFQISPYALSGKYQFTSLAIAGARSDRPVTFEIQNSKTAPLPTIRSALIEVHAKTTPAVQMVGTPPWYHPAMIWPRNHVSNLVLEVESDSPLTFLRYQYTYGATAPVTLSTNKDLRLENVKYLGNNLYRLEIDFTLQAGRNLLNAISITNQKQLETAVWNDVQAASDYTENSPAK